MGLRLLTTWQALYPDARMERTALAAHGGRRIRADAAGRVCGACAAPAWPARRAVAAFAYTRLAATVSAAMRLIPIGQTEAHALLARTLDACRKSSAIVAATPHRVVRAGADIAAMTQQYSAPRRAATTRVGHGAQQ